MDKEIPMKKRMERVEEVMKEVREENECISIKMGKTVHSTLA